MDYDHTDLEYVSLNCFLYFAYIVCIYKILGILTCILRDQWL